MMPFDSSRRAAAADGALRDDERRALRADALGGLLATPKTLPPKLFYDAEGARLFERITELPEYYLTRAELEILRAHRDEIAGFVGAGAALVEYGSGAGIKVRMLLEALGASAYVPIDIADEQLARVASEIAAGFPNVSVRPLLADYTAPLTLPALPTGARRVAFFPGSTIGNFHPAEATAFLRRIRRSLGDGGVLILGVDRVKDSRVIEAAYNDAAGVTAAFNLNVLRRLNRELGATFDLARFAHRAWFDREASRVEMHLESLSEQTALVDGVPIHLDAGETIWTESSYKFDDAQLEAIATAGGFAVARRWSDASAQFTVALLEAR